MASVLYENEMGAAPLPLPYPATSMGDRLLALCTSSVLRGQRGPMLRRALPFISPLSGLISAVAKYACEQRRQARQR